MRRVGQASIIGTTIFAVILLAAIGTLAYTYNLGSQYNQAANHAQQILGSHNAEALTFQALTNGTLAVRDTGSSASKIVAVILKFANGTVYNLSPQRVIGSDNLLQVPSLISSTHLPKYNYILSSTNTGDSIGIVTSLGNAYWLKPAVAVQTNNPQLTTSLTFEAQGDDAFGSTNPVLVVDGNNYYALQLPLTLTWFIGTQHTYAYQTLPQGTGTRVGISSVSGAASTTSGTITAKSMGTVQASYITQYLLTVTGGNGVAITPSSPSGDGWYNAGTTVQVSTDYVWGAFTSQSRTNLLSYYINGATPTAVTRSGSGTFTAPSVAMNSPNSIVFGNVAQYYLSVSGGNGVSNSAASQTGDGWYDTGTQLTVSSNWVWTVVSGQSRTALTGWSLDGVNQYAPRGGSGTLATSTITMSTHHSVNFPSTTQYYLTLAGGGGFSYSAPSQTADSWFDSGTVTTAQSANAFNVVTGQSRQNLISYALDGMQTALTRFGTGYSGPSITFNTYHSLSFSSVTQYALNANGGNSVSYSGSQTGDGWYDSGSTATTTTNYVWGVVTGQSRLNLMSWNLDGGANQAVTRSGTGTFTTTQITVNTFHTVNFNSLTQYYVTTQSGVPSSGTVSALTVGYQYTAQSTVSQALSNPGFESASLTPWSYSCGYGSATVSSTTVHSGSYSGYTSYPNDAGWCSISQGFAAPSGATILSVSGSAFVYWNGQGAALIYDSCGSFWANNPSSNSWQQVSKSSSCSSGTTYVTFSMGVQGNCVVKCYTGSAYWDDATFTYTYSMPYTGTFGTGLNSYAVNGGAVTYSYSLSYNFPAGSYARQLQVTIPSTETYQGINCGTASVSGSTVTVPDSTISSCGANFTIMSTSSGTASGTIAASPANDGWYDFGSSIAITATGTGRFSFSSWSASDANLPIASTTSASTTVTINTYGTVTANFNVNA